MQLCRSQAAEAPGAMGDGFLACRGLVLTEDLCHQLNELWEPVSRLHSIRGDKKEINQFLSETLQLLKPEPSAAAGGQAESLRIRLESRNSHGGESRNQVSSTPGRKAPASHEIGLVQLPGSRPCPVKHWSQSELNHVARGNVTDSIGRLPTSGE